MQGFVAGIGPFHDPVTWYGINYAGTQKTQWDFQNKGTLTSPAQRKGKAATVTYLAWVAGGIRERASGSRATITSRAPPAREFASGKAASETHSSPILSRICNSRSPLRYQNK